MKLVSLNCWGGRLRENLEEYIRTQAADTDIFCLQEVFRNTAGEEVHREYRANLYGELQALLPDHVGDFVSARTGLGIDYKPVDYDLSFGTAVFVRKGLAPKFSSATLDIPRPNSHDYHLIKKLHVLELSVKGKSLAIGSIHGLWIPDIGKIDTPDRLKQSEEIRRHMDGLAGAKIVCGDLNLDPDTKSLAILAEGYHNLITEYDIDTTRSPYYKKPAKFADYMLVNDQITVNDFSVPKVEASDHLPMELDFLVA